MYSSHTKLNKTPLIGSPKFCRFSEFLSGIRRARACGGAAWQESRVYVPMKGMNAGCRVFELRNFSRRVEDVLIYATYCEKLLVCCQITQTFRVDAETTSEKFQTWETHEFCGKGKLS